MGAVARHGGGAFSGKDPTKVNRSGAYAARYVAKNIVAAGLARKCELQVAYAIGVAKPVSITVDTFGTGLLPSGKLEELVQEVFDLRPAAIIKTWTFAGHSTGKPPVMGILGGPIWICLGKGWTRCEVLKAKAGC